jgi:peptidoglycan/xylan/chitin deacetylase (PgdA/CDA1 family)
MPSTRVNLMQQGLLTMHTLGVHELLRPMAQGLGLIVTMHRVRPAHELRANLEPHAGFDPNSLLEVTPDFLDRALSGFKSEGLSIVSMDEAVEAIASAHVRKGRFAALTFDDGYIDNRTHALPVLESHDAPCTIYVPSHFPQGRGELWWVALENMIRDADSMVSPLDRSRGSQPIRTDDEKLAFYLELYWQLRNLPQEDQRTKMAELALEQGYDMHALCRQLILSTPDMIEIARHKLVTIGAHTASHSAVATLSPQAAMDEMVQGADWLEEKLGKRPRHFAYPYGDEKSAGPRDFELAREAGFASAVTTRKGMIYSQHRDHMFALPRVSLNGNFQHQRFISLFASGAPFLLANGFRKVA